MSESEKATERYLTLEIKKIFGLSFKWSSLANRGVPDRICLFSPGIFALVEVKSEGKKPTKLQQYTIDIIRKMGFRVEVIDTKAGVDLFIQSIKEQIKCVSLTTLSS